MALLFVGSTGLAFAQSTGADKIRPKKRLKIQRKRIKQGIKDGTISKSEAQTLHQEGVSINQERKADLKADGGKLTTADKQKLEGELDQRSKQIYDDKHPATGATGAATNGN